eukprot:9371613-Alexandrium_andersonii.AAC.1
MAALSKVALELVSRGVSSARAQKLIGAMLDRGVALQPRMRRRRSSWNGGLAAGRRRRRSSARRSPGAARRSRG